MMIGRLRPIIGLKTEFLLDLTYGFDPKHKPLEVRNPYFVHVLEAHPPVNNLSGGH